MKTEQVAANGETLRITRYAEELRDLVLRAHEDGVQLSMPPIEDPAALKQKQLNYRQHRVVMAIPLVHHHQFLGTPTHVVAAAVIDTRPKACALDCAIVRPTLIERRDSPVN